jgi:hypothetical protein
MSARPCGHRWDLPLPDAAHQYAGFGYAVLPLEPGAKKPHRMLGETGGVHHATTSAEQVIRWWSQDPQANIGVATGTASQLVVADLDTKKTDGPGNFWQFLKDGNRSVSWDASAQTPSGGWHIWLRLWPGMHASRERPGILPGVDIKGNGGYVAAAPSVIAYPDGGGGLMDVPYAWKGWSCPCSASLAPAWMHDWISYAAPTGAARLDSSELPEVEEAKQHGFGAGERNVSFYLMDCRLYGAGGVSADSDALVIEANRAVWSKTEQKGMTWTEVERCRRSARTFIERNREAELTIAAALAEWERNAFAMTAKARRSRARGW